MATPRIAVPRFPPPSRENEPEFRRALEQWCGEVVVAIRTLAEGPDVLTDATRGTQTAGRVIFNSDDGNLNIGDGSDWITPDGSTT